VHGPDHGQYYPFGECELHGDGARLSSGLEGGGRPGRCEDLQYVTTMNHQKSFRYRGTIMTILCSRSWRCLCAPASADGSYAGNDETICEKKAKTHTQGASERFRV